MALTLEQFRERFPAFEDTPEGLVRARLDEAARAVSASSWGPRADDAHGLLTAHMLALEPMGEQARLKLPGGGETTTYGRRFEELRKRTHIPLLVS